MQKDNEIAKRERKERKEVTIIPLLTLIGQFNLLGDPVKFSVALLTFKDPLMHFIT